MFTQNYFSWKLLLFESDRIRVYAVNYVEIRKLQTTQLCGIFEGVKKKRRVFFFCFSIYLDSERNGKCIVGFYAVFISRASVPPKNSNQKEYVPIVYIHMAYAFLLLHS